MSIGRKQGFIKFGVFAKSSKYLLFHFISKSQTTAHFSKEMSFLDF